jgi:hypothetical protein
MAQIPRKSVRKLITLPPDLAERVEKFRETSGASSESEALKALVEAGLKLRDRPEDLFQRCETSTSGGQSIGEIINLVTTDHPLVESTVTDKEALTVYLKKPESEAPRERFRYSRSQGNWKWEWEREYDQWMPVERPKQAKAKPGGDLDDDIPF